MHIPIDYSCLRLIWWVLLGVLLIGFAIMDGFDLGVGMLLNWVARTNSERRVVINTVGPFWEGNQIWLILGAGAIFAAWPEIYAVTFSGFYCAMLMVLFALILRPVGFKYRSKIDNPQWRMVWDVALFIGGFVPALIFGVAIGNVLQGVPFHFDETLRSYYTGSFWQLLNPFAILCGLISVYMLGAHGALYLAMKTEQPIVGRARKFAFVFATLTLVLFMMAGWFIATSVPGYEALPMNMNGPSNPLHKQVYIHLGAWVSNYVRYPFTKLAPLLGITGIVLSLLALLRHHYKLAWALNALSIAGIITTVGVSMFPFILPSSSHPNMSLTVWDASSSHLTLFVMLIVTLIFLPLIILYTSWVYYVLRGKVSTAAIEKNQSGYY